MALGFRVGDLVKRKPHYMYTGTWGWACAAYNCNPKGIFKITHIHPFCLELEGFEGRFGDDKFDLMAPVKPKSLKGYEAWL